MRLSLCCEVHPLPTYDSIVGAHRRQRLAEEAPLPVLRASLASRGRRAGIAAASKFSAPWLGAAMQARIEPSSMPSTYAWRTKLSQV